MIETIFYFALNQADYDRVKSTINPRTISFVPQGDGSGIIYKAGIPYSGSGDLDYSKVVNIIKLYFGSDDFEWPELPDPSDIHGGNSYTAYVDNSINNSLLEFAAGEKERVLEYINSKDAEVRALVENIFQNYQELIRHYLETGDSDFSAFTFGDPDLVEWMSVLGHVTDNQDGTYSVNWSDILQTISQFQADVNQVLANPTLFGNEWYDTEKVWNLENDTVNENDNTFKGFYTDEDTLRAVKANIGDWAVLTVDDRSTVWRYGKPVEIDYDVLSSALYTYIENNYTSSGMSSTWAKVLGKVDEFDEETRTVLEWMASDIKTWAGGYWYDTNVEYDEENLDEERFLPNKKVGDVFTSEEELQATHATAGDWALLIKDNKTTIWKYSNKTFADVMVSAREYADNGEDVLRLAAAGLNAIVKKDENGHYVASSTLTALVNDEVGTRLADLQLESLDDEALAALYAHIDNKILSEIEGLDVSELSTSVAGLTTKVSKAEGDIDGLDARITNAENTLQAKADASTIYTKTDIDGKVETLTTSISSASTLAQLAETTFTNWKDDTANGFAAFKTSTNNTLSSKASISQINNLQKQIDGIESGVITYSDVNGWIANGDITWNGSTGVSLKSKIGSVESAISTKVTKDANGVISDATISADNINFGTTKVPFENLNITGENIEGAISNIKLKVNNIDISSLTGDLNFILAINSNISVNELTAGGNNKTVTANSSGVVVTRDASFKSAEFNTDGSGSLANNAISWNSNGDMTIGSAFIDKLNTENIVAKTLNAVNGNKKITANSQSLSITNGSTTAAEFNVSGAGNLANGNISWDATGDTHIGDTSVDSLKIYTDTYLLAIFGDGEYAQFSIYEGSNTLGSKCAAISANNNSGGWMHLWSSGYDTAALNSTDRSDAYINSKCMLMHYNYGNGDSRAVSMDCSDTTASVSVQEIIGGNVRTAVLTPNGVSTTSDMRFKDVIKEKHIAIDDISNAPLFDFKWKNQKDDRLFIGTSALYWQSIIPESVHNENGQLVVNYASVATASAITAAREIVSLKNRIKELEDKILLLLDAANK